jgi:hypothetical protein
MVIVLMYPRFLTFRSATASQRLSGILRDKQDRNADNPKDVRNIEDSRSKRTKAQVQKICYAPIMENSVHEISEAACSQERQGYHLYPGQAWPERGRENQPQSKKGDADLKDQGARWL